MKESTAKSIENTNDAKEELIESIQSVIKGIQNINYVEEFDKNLSNDEKNQRKRFLIYRFDPSNQNDAQKYVSYYVDLKKIRPMYLDALIYIKDNYDSSLSLRRSCREGICGSCSMNCNGFNTLACTKQIETDLDKPIIITPLSHMFVLKDLIVDMTNFFDQYRYIQPWLQRKDVKSENDHEYYQSVDDRKKLDGLYECILCACCSASCPSYWWYPDKYLGPAALLHAYRWIIDSRDQYKEERLNRIKGQKIEDCENIGMCTTTCPKGLSPSDAIVKQLKIIKEQEQKQLIEECL